MAGEFICRHESEIYEPKRAALPNSASISNNRLYLAILGATHRAGLDLAAARSHGKVGNERVLGFARTVGKPRESRISRALTEWMRDFIACSIDLFS